MGFLVATERDQVRKAAVRALAAYSADDQQVDALAGALQNMLTPLARMLDDHPHSNLAPPAAATLVNLSQREDCAEQMLRHDGLVDAAARHTATELRDAVDSTMRLDELCSMLLTNLTQPDLAGGEGCRLLLQSHHFGAVVLNALHTPARVSPYLLSALAHVLTLPSGREALLADALAVRGLCGALPGGGERAEHGARAVRNLCFAIQPNAPGRERLLPHLRAIIIASALSLESPAPKYNYSERAALARTVGDAGLEDGGSGSLAWGRGEQRADNALVRLALTEVLLVLTSAREGRDALRHAGVYPLLRDSHLAETDEDVVDANEKLVGEFYLDEEERGPAPWAPLPGTVEEPN